MDVIRGAVSALAGGRAGEPVGAIKIVDPSPANWLYVNYNVDEELIRVSPSGWVEPAAMQSYRWADDRTLEVAVRDGNVFPDGERLTAATVKRAFDELMRWSAPHPPGTHFNNDPRTTCEVTGAMTVRFHYPEPDGLALGKLRAMHVMSTRFWEEVGFGYARTQSGEGHW